MPAVKRDIGAQAPTGFRKSGPPGLSGGASRSPRVGEGDAGGSARGG
jgi:hypothetical protein